MKTIFAKKKWLGFSDYLKDEVEPDHYYFAQALDYRSDPNSLTLLPASLLESGSVVTDLLKFADIVPSDLSVYSVGSNGGFYKRTSAGSWSLLRSVANAHGNGVSYFTGDDYIYYPIDSTIGRYGPISNNPQFSDDFLGSQGGVRLNTYSATLVSASSQYATKTDTASLSITGNLTMECYINPASLPTTGNSMVLMSKWRSGNNTRSYKFDIAGVSAVFGNGSDSNLVISADTTDAPIDSACTGTTGSNSLSATNASFASGQEILIHQTQGTNAGTYMRNKIISYTAGTITLDQALNITYGTGAQVLVLKQYVNVTVNSGKTWTAKAWNGTVGGILGFLCNGTFTNNGIISASAKGFRGTKTRISDTSVHIGIQGEGYSSVGSATTSANTIGGGGGNENTETDRKPGGGGGGYATIGTNGTKTGSREIVGIGGETVGISNLTSLFFGGGGGQGAYYGGVSSTSVQAGSGGGIVFIYGSDTINNGYIYSNGENGSTSIPAVGGCGAGAGGSVLIKCQTATLGTNLITVSGGIGGTGYNEEGSGGNGGIGRIHVDYYTSVTGTTTPTLDSSQDNNLSTNTTYQLRLWISSNGTVQEILARTCGLTIGIWKHVAVNWTAASHLAEFFLNGNSLGTSSGAYTSISDNASSFVVGSQDTDLGSYYNGKMDEIRLWNIIRSASDIYKNKDVQISGSTTGLVAYYQLNNSWADLTANANDLTPTNSPTFTTDTPFLSPSTRLDIDLSQVATGQTYTVPVAISETVANTVYFTPNKDPLKSISVLIAAKGTGNWTLTLHDFSNTVVATSTITNANLIAGVQNEFIFSTPYRFQIGATYHFHLTSTVADGTVTTDTTANLSTVSYNTYFQILVTDTDFHPAVPFLNFEVIGNERYLATWNGVFYEPNQITFPPQTSVRCFAFWRNYLAIGTWRRKTSGATNIYDWDKGRIYFWDGISLTFNFWVDVPEGQINAMVGNNSLLYIFAGFRGDLLVYEGGFTSSGSNLSTKLKKIPLLSRGDYTDIYPGAINMWRSLIHFGAVANSSSTTLTRAVYSWGTINKLYPETLSLDYPISTGSTGTSVKIGLVYPVGQTLLIGWQDGNSYGCDQVNFSNRPASYGTINTLTMDGGQVWKQNLVMKARADHKTLLTGETITMKYRLDRESNWETTGSITDTSGQFTMINVANGRGKEYQFGVDMYSTNGTSPTLLEMSGLVDDTSEESQF
jgi:hypothetical protein